jgi:hypothetical protein
MFNPLRSKRMEPISCAKMCPQANSSANLIRTLVIILFLLSMFNPAYAWGSVRMNQVAGLEAMTAPSHDYIVEEAYANLENDLAYNEHAFPPLGQATTAEKPLEETILDNEGQYADSSGVVSGNGPDSPTQKTKYSWHEYNPDLNAGEAPQQSAEWFEKLKKDIEDEKWSKTAKDAAFLAHYIADVSCPFHINGRPRQEDDANILGEKISFPLPFGITGHPLPISKIGMGRNQTPRSDEILISGFPEGARVRGTGGMGNKDWFQEYSTWQNLPDKDLNDWFDPWYNDGTFTYRARLLVFTVKTVYLPEASSTHALWEWYAHNNYSRPTYPATKVGYSKEFLEIQKRKGNGDPDNIAEFAKEIARNTRINQKAILDESTTEDTQRDINSELGKAYQEAISDVYTVWRASFSALRPEISLERDQKTGSRKIVVTIENKADEDAKDVKVNLKISNATISGPEGKGLTSSSYDIPEDIDKKFEVKDVWELEEPDPADASKDKGDIEIDAEVTGKYEKTPDSGRAVIKKIIKNEVANSIILLFDASGSMGDNNKIDNAKSAANSFLTSKVQPEDEVGLIVFYDCGSIVVEEPFTTDKSALTSKIDAIEPSGSTPIYAAMEFAKEYMNQHARGKTQKIIMFTDGMETCGGDQQ